MFVQHFVDLPEGIVAQRIVTTLLDDIDGSPADRTIKFTVAGKSYSIDLNAKHIEEFDKALEPYISAATKVGSTSTRRSGSRPASSSGSASDIRSWAKQQGLAVSPRGRISTDLRERYLASH